MATIKNSCEGCGGVGFGSPKELGGLAPACPKPVRK